MANGLISAGRYGGPQDAIVEDPNVEAPAQPSMPLPFQDEPEPVSETVPMPATVPVDPDRNIAEEQNWMKQIQDYAAKNYPNENEREDFIERASRYTRNNIAMTRASNRQILQTDQQSLDKVLEDHTKFQGRGPRNDYEANQINPGWAAMRDLALQHDPNFQKRIDTAYKFNSNMDVPPTTERQTRYDQARAQIDRAIRGFPGTDRYEVLRTLNPNALDLPKMWTKDLHDQLTNLRKQRNIDNTMNVYMGWAQPMLNQAHILATDDAKMMQFEGALSRELKGLQSTSKDPEAPLTREQVYQKTSELLRREVYSRGPFGSSIFEFEVPKGYMTPERITKFQNATGHMPSPQEIYTLYSMHKAGVFAGTEEPDRDKAGNIIDPYYVIESYRKGQK